MVGRPTVAVPAAATSVARLDHQVGGPVEVPVTFPLVEGETFPLGPVVPVGATTTVLDASSSCLQVATRVAGPGRPVAPRQTADHHVEAVVAGLTVAPAGTVPSSVAGQVDARRRDAPDVDAAAGETGGEASKMRRQEDVVPAHLLPTRRPGARVQDPTLPTHQVLRPTPAKVLLRETDPATAPNGPNLEGPG